MYLRIKLWIGNSKIICTLDTINMQLERIETTLYQVLNRTEISQEILKAHLKWLRAHPRKFPVFFFSLRAHSVCFGKYPSLLNPPPSPPPSLSPLQTLHPLLPHAPSSSFSSVPSLSMNLSPSLFRPLSSPLLLILTLKSNLNSKKK